MKRKNEFVIRLRKRIERFPVREPKYICGLRNYSLVVDDKFGVLHVWLCSLIRIRIGRTAECHIADSRAVRTGRIQDDRRD